MIDPSACPASLIIRSPSKPTISSYFIHFQEKTILWPQGLPFLFYKQRLFKVSLHCKLAAKI